MGLHNGRCCDGMGACHSRCLLDGTRFECPARPFCHRCRIVPRRAHWPDRSGGNDPRCQTRLDHRCSYLCAPRRCLVDHRRCARLGAGISRLGMASVAAHIGTSALATSCLSEPLGKPSDCRRSDAGGVFELPGGARHGRDGRMTSSGNLWSWPASRCGGQAKPGLVVPPRACQNSIPHNRLHDIAD